ncbi:hypothetical protein SteCoe_13865 [Stentor coeruleus]|uniref:FHA domain-containing protein n=1 Tax=Stentor coeruleus TaxID=5963 RepID=A0A1R2C7H0_9CILI|nr:hypothetical protein SteCoe_13865 [Stentor coeruleus]
MNMFSEEKGKALKLPPIRMTEKGIDQTQDRPEEKAEIILPMKRQATNPSGYAKLYGKEISCIIQYTEVILGRTNPKNKKECFIPLGDHKKISRKHAKIFWNTDKGCFQIQNIGKNPIIVNKVDVLSNEIVDLLGKTPIKIGPACFYFLLPN